MKLLLIITIAYVSVIFTNNALAQNWNDDHLKHFVVSVAMSGVLTSVLCSSGYKPKEAILLGMGVTLGIGFGKELLDSTQPMNYFDQTDMAANAMGTAAGMIFVPVLGACKGIRQ